MEEDRTYITMTLVNNEQVSGKVISQTDDEIVIDTSPTHYTYRKLVHVNPAMVVTWEYSANDPSLPHHN